MTSPIGWRAHQSRLKESLGKRGSVGWPAARDAGSASKQIGFWWAVRDSNPRLPACKTQIDCLYLYQLLSMNSLKSATCDGFCGSLISIGITQFVCCLPAISTSVFAVNALSADGIDASGERKTTTISP